MSHVTRSFETFNLISLSHEVSYYLVNIHIYFRFSLKLYFVHVSMALASMEDIKQLLKNIDSYMAKLIELVELIEIGDFPQSEGQFFIFGLL